MRTITLEELLEAGCHFGHQVTRQNPRARDFVFEARDNIHIIDLAKTKEGLEKAAAFVKDLGAKEGTTLLLLGAKRQADAVVRDEVKRVQDAGIDGLFSVTTRWIGGIFTNFPEVSKNFKKLQDLGERLQSEEEKAKYTKKEISLWAKEKQKLETFYGGISNMRRSPDAIFIIDTHLEDMAVKEATRTGVTTVGITDTNSDPELIDYPIPANDDAVGSIKLITNYIVDAWIEGRKQAEKKQEAGNKIKEEKKPVEKVETTTEEKIEKPKKETVTKKKTEKKAKTEETLNS